MSDSRDPELSEDPAPAADASGTEGSRLWFEHLADATPDIIFVLDIVENRNVYSSRSLSEVLGYDPLEFKSIENILQQVIPQPDLDSAARFYAAMRDAQRGEVRQISHRAFHRSGAIRWIENRVTPFSWDPDGRVREVIGIAADVTSRHELEIEHARLANLIEHSDDFIAMADFDGFLTYINAGGRRLIGLDPSRDLRTVRITDYVAPEWSEKFRDEVLTILRKTGQWKGEMQLMHLGTGERIDVDRNTYVLNDPDTGEPVGYATVTRDIRKQKMAEDQLRRSEELVRTIAENSTQGLAMMNERGYCTYANHSWLVMTGYSREEIASRPLHDLVHHHNAGGHPLPKDKCPIDRALPENFSLRAHEDMFFKKDGTSFPVICSASPVFKNGRPVSTVVEIRDVTEAKRAEIALRQSEEEFRTLADNISQLAWMADPSGSLFWYNRRWFEYTGTRFEDMKGWGWRTIHHPDHLERVEAKFRSAVESGAAWEDTFPLRGADGVFRWFLSRALPIRDEQGNVVRWFGTNTDITELRETQEALRQADRLKDDFLATLSHELRTPLSAILGWTQLLRKGKSTPDDFALALETIHRSARAQADLIEDVLDISRITGGRMRLERKAADPAAIVEAALATIAPAAEAKEIRIESSVDRTIGEMYADPGRLQQILWNLLSNAIKFSPRESRVTLTLRRESDTAVFEVKDNGPGITPEFLPHVFDRFRQADSSTRRAHGGLGIGLSLVKELTYMHGGNVSVRSAPAEGATFRVTIPIVQSDAPAPASPGDDTTGSRKRLHGVRTLVVDDDPDARLIIATMLRKRGAAAIEAASVEEALDAIERERPDVVITDIAMPGRDGFDLIDSMRSDSRLDSIPVLAVTAHPAAEAEDAARSRFAAHLRKPIDPSQLARAVARAVGRE